MNDPRELWQNQTTESFRMSAEEIRKRMEEESRKARRRNIMFLILSAVVLMGFSSWLRLVQGLVPRAGAILAMAGVGFVVYQARSNHRAERLALQQATESGAVPLDFYRRQLERQRDFHGKQFWSRLLVLLPGPLIFIVGIAQESPHALPIVAIDVILFFVVAAIGARRNLAAAHNYERQIEELNGLENGIR